MTSVSSLIRFCGDLERGYAGEGGVWILFYSQFYYTNYTDQLVSTVIAFSFVNLIAASGIEELLVEWKV
ncbi:hypothetical protein Peur_046417 [Populus x canadensis]